MEKSVLIKKYQELGDKWLKGYNIKDFSVSGKKYVLSEKQVKFLNSKKRYVLYSGGYGCGKSLVLLMKMVLLCLMFPKNRVLLGRKTLSDIERNTLPDLFDLIPSGWYEHRVKDALINFFNGSQVILFGLDALQAGSEADIKKAQQKVKSLNLGGFFIDQLEEIEKDVFTSLGGRLRRTETPLRQGNMTTNPANFWAYDYFKKNPARGTFLIEGSMLDNQTNLPKDYIEDQLNHDDNYVRRYVYGEWTPQVLIENSVFADEYIKRFEALRKPPLKTEEGCEIWEDYERDKTYQMGVDPSEGVVDPSSISVVKSTGEKVARFNGFTTIPGLTEKVKFLNSKYHEPLIIPEVNAAGVALLEAIKDLNIYRRQVFEYREKREVKKLGWKTSHSSKQALISHFKELLRANFPKIYDESTINEFRTFVWSDSAKQKGAGAQKGFHDDDVISTLLSYWQLKPVTQEVNALKQRLLKLKRRAKRKVDNCI